ncbi:MAG: hypothetical protein ABIH45_02735 [Candidatus Omnitrophota bacterium]
MKNQLEHLVIEKKSFLYPIAILISFLVCFSALARVRIVPHKNNSKSEFSPSTKEFSVASKTFEGTLKEYQPSGDNSLSIKEEVSASTLEFKSSSAELIEPKYKAVTRDPRYFHRHRHCKSYLHLSELNLSESFSQSGDFSPSAEFKISQKKSRRIR